MDLEKKFGITIASLMTLDDVNAAIIKIIQHPESIRNDGTFTNEALEFNKVLDARYDEIFSNFTPEEYLAFRKKIHDEVLSKFKKEEKEKRIQESNEVAQDEKCIQKSKRGGKRMNSGRKKQEKTVMVRCPESIKDKILSIIKRYKETGTVEV